VALVTDAILVRARRALLDALEALGPHRESVVLVGAQAVYLHTGAADVALAEFTIDADLAFDARTLGDDPRIEAAMASAGFEHGVSRNPGVWTSKDGVQVDLMVPAAIAGSGRRSVHAPPHDRSALRKSSGLEAALVDQSSRSVSSLDSSDSRAFDIAVAGPAALLVAKLHKLADRIAGERAVENKDAHDVYRILVAIGTTALADDLRLLAAHPLSGSTTTESIGFLAEYFAAGPDAAGSRMAGAAEELVGDPATVGLAASILASDLRAALRV